MKPPGEGVETSTARDLIAVSEDVIEQPQAAVAGPGLGDPAERDTP
jgi:hypothetical protein